MALTLNVPNNILINVFFTRKCLTCERSRLQVARKSNNTLGLKVYSPESAATAAAAAGGVTEDTLNVTADVSKQTVQMKVTDMEAETQPSEGTTENKIDENCVIIDVEDEPVPAPATPVVEGASAG